MKLKIVKEKEKAKISRANKIHVHKITQMQKCSYKKVYMKYGMHIDENGMIDPAYLTKCTSN